MCWHWKRGWALSQPPSSQSDSGSGSESGSGSGSEPGSGSGSEPGSGSGPESGFANSSGCRFSEKHAFSEAIATN